MLDDLIKDDIIKVVARNRYGYLQCGPQELGGATLEEYVHNQQAGSSRVANWVLPFLQKDQRVLEVGCGVGALVSTLNSRGMNVYGLDVPYKAPQWAAIGLDRERFVCGDGSSLPFKDNSFDVVISFGVIEHIGTVDGIWRLRDDYKELRQSYASEIMRVTRGGGKIIIGCPNKSCPIDPAHYQPPENRIRDLIFRKTGLNLHRTWGDWYLLSHREVRQFFSGTHNFRSLPLKGYFAFSKFQKWPVLRPLKSAIQGWVEDMPQWAANSFLSPYVMVEMTNGNKDVPSLPR